MDDFPWDLEIRIQIQTGARELPRLRECSFRKFYQTVRECISCDLHIDGRHSQM